MLSIDSRLQDLIPSDQEMMDDPPGSPLLRLPSEIIQSILTYLSPLNLSTLSQVSRFLRTHAYDDSLWRDHVRSNIPDNSPLTLPSSVHSYRELYVAHHPYWFLTRHKLWFSDAPHTGKLVLARYDPRTDAVEGYALVAGRGPSDMYFWEHDPSVVIHTFAPKVQLDLNQPVLKLNQDCWVAEDEEDDTDGYKSAESARNGFLSRVGGGLTGYFGPGPPVTGSSYGAGMESSTDGSRRSSNRRRGAFPLNREVVMPIHGATTGSGLFSQFSLTRALHPNSIGPTTAVWPPRRIPSAQRVRNSSARLFTGSGHRPDRQQHVCDIAFRLRKGLSLARGLGPTVLRRSLNWVPLPQQQNNNNNANNNGGGDAAGDNRLIHTLLTTRVPREEVATFATLPPEAYTPTRARPWRGIWAGDYAGHGIEFLALLQPDDPAPLPEAARVAYEASRREDLSAVTIVGGAGGALTGMMGLGLGAGPSGEYVAVNGSAPGREGDVARENGVHDATEEERVYEGRIEAVKLTGDPNIPRGEYTFIAPDIGDGGLIRVAREEMFRGARIVRSLGHIAGMGFRDDKFVPSQLIMISENQLAQYWKALGHISFYERVDIDRFLNVE